MNDVEIITFGCRLNTYESQIIKDNLQKQRMHEGQQIVVFNTCAVTQDAEKEAIRAIRRIKAQKPNAQIIVTGCAAQIKPELFADMEEVSKVLGNQEKLLADNYHSNSSHLNNLPQNSLQQERDEGGEKEDGRDCASINRSKISVNNIFAAKHIPPIEALTHFENRSRAFLQIQNGCNHRCSFCIIPYARGRSRSVPVGVIVDQINKLLQNGYKEIVFTGVDITGYGLDLPARPSLAQMTRRVLKLVPNLSRLRFSSIDVAEINDELMELMAHEKRIMPHFHLSLQSGDNDVLQLMRRRHNRQQILDFCYNIKAARPDATLGADIIAGFPMESEEMFLNTFNLIHEAGLQFLHVFPYSVRTGTPAASMPQIAMEIRKKRAKLLRAQGNEQLKLLFASYVGKTVDVLMEGGNVGRCENFIKVQLEDGEEVRGVWRGTANNKPLSELAHDEQIQGAYETQLPSGVEPRKRSDIARVRLAGYRGNLMLGELC
ncbi:Threonylcarbamoyladenosine tRNA methylthiotransferase MtaB [Rickettsiales endosymbiont of Paramecium tredecaurelia]|uniref:tRNA (N(6)-L-threonylcarbamoyladenosine(37)-C(2))- methylthiotransferase MtaB n=1 Tax=Candidatus Sarmatiella mevalonica TaxID=2770581 RepID=UPI001922C74A|nr:tRNA (N(6)-L-threonylcarbamoyladenosine(37)-C(2))-methylthiotransferase MtaB [Candidatus Sarmatiella mevalonica]MBL3284292.1 Threonylcarbamoyladenosine tRNA methylthiotransferase MtaB [Candidatus Sarmatiella mevalonica]